MVRLQVQLTEEQLRMLKILASKNNTSLSELVRRSVDQWIGTKKSMEISNRIQRGLAIAGRFHSECSDEDASTQHDRYLTEIYQS